MHKRKLYDIAVSNSLCFLSQEQYLPVLIQCNLFSLIVRKDHNSLYFLVCDLGPTCSGEYGGSVLLSETADIPELNLSHTSTFGIKTLMC